MNEHNLKRIESERLEHGRKLRESTTLIKCLAIVEYDDGSNWQEVEAYIPSEEINSEGYVEQVWIAPESIFIGTEEVNGEVYLLINSNWLVNFNSARIDRFSVSRQVVGLLPSPNLVVKYRIDNQLTERLLKVFGAR